MGTRLSLPFQVTHTWTEAEFRNSFDSDFDGWGDMIVRGDQLPYIAQHQIAVGAGIVDRRWSTFATLRWTDSMRTQAGSGRPAAGESTDATFLVDLTARYELREGLRLFVQTRNLTDQTYVAARRPSGLRPGLPRTTLFGIHWAF